jgi:ribonuclease J
MNKKNQDELVFVPLGGVGEIGMNMSAYGFGSQYNRKWIVVDCGVTFGDLHQPGIELIMADPTFLEEEADNVLALILTHSHEDHYGAVLDLWPSFNKPVYATAFTKSMLEAKRIGNNISEKVRVIDMLPGKAFKLGDFEIEAIRMAHSIPECNSLLIKTPVGSALHTGDWKIDGNPISSLPTDEKRLKEIAKRSDSLALICDSTNATKGGQSPSEAEIAVTLENLIANAKHRVAVTTFASNLGRIISIARAAQKAGRQVVLSGLSLHRVTTIAKELGLLEDLEPFLDQDAYTHLPRNKVVLICTGSQGESRAAVSRIARGVHPVVDLNAGDMMIFSSWAIPGNEKEVIDIQNRLIDKGIDIITNADELVHVTGHPRRGELTQLYDWVKPDVLVPVHGEAMHLEAQAELGKSHGIKQVFSIRNGDMVRLAPLPEVSPAEIRVGELYLDGNILCTPEESGVRARKRLSFGGMVSVSLCVDRGGNITSGPDMDIVGMPLSADDDEDILEVIIEQSIESVIASMPAKRRSNINKLNEAIRRGVRSELAGYWGKKPNVKIYIHEV